MSQEKKKWAIKVSPKFFYGSLAALGLVAIFFVGVLLGRAYSEAGLPGAATIQRLRAKLVHRAQPPQGPTPTSVGEIQKAQQTLPAPATTSIAVEVARISPEELKDKLDSGADLIIVDVRDQEAFDGGHIKGAVSIPLSEMEARHDELAGDKEIVFYGDSC